MTSHRGQSLCFFCLEVEALNLAFCQEGKNLIFIPFFSAKMEAGGRYFLIHNLQKEKTASLGGNKKPMSRVRH